MSNPDTTDQILVALSAAETGDEQAASTLLPLVYAELRELARSRIARQAPGQTLQPTALVHEAFIRITKKSDVSWQGRRHFFFAAARAMRDILVEQARRKARPKHGGGLGREDLDRVEPISAPPSDDLLAINEALDELEKDSPFKAQIILLRFFVGMTMEEISEVLEMPERTLRHHWRYLRAWLKTRLADVPE